DDRLRRLHRARRRRPRVALVIAGEEPHLPCPGALCLLGLRLEHDQRGLALPREDGQVVALHAPVVGEVEDVVGRADDERVELALDHQRAHPLELRVVARPRHARADWIARQTFSPFAGMSTWRTPRCDSASTTAFCTAGVAPIVPDSPMPFAPSSLSGVGVSIGTSSNDGSSAALGKAYATKFPLSGLPSSS